MRLLAGHDQEVAAWAGQRLGTVFHPPLAAFAMIDSDDIPRAAAIFNDFQGRGGSVELTYVGRVTRESIRFMVRYAFVDLGASRITCKTAKTNKTVQAMLRKAGFTYEAVLKRYRATTDGGDVVCFALFRRDAQRWLN